MSKTQQTAQLAMTAARYGISAQDLSVLLAAERTLHRWSERECGDGNNYASWAIERDEETDIPYLVTYPHTGDSYRTRIQDREAGAKRRIAKVMERYPDLLATYQGDPRGCSLYIVRKADVEGLDPCNWTSRGFAVCL